MKSVWDAVYAGDTKLLLAGLALLAGTAHARGPGAVAALAHASEEGPCTETVVGPDDGTEARAAIDAAAPGDTICLSGDFALGAVPLSVPADKVGLTLTSEDPDEPATLTADDMALVLSGTTNVTVSHLTLTGGNVIRVTVADPKGGLDPEDCPGAAGQTSNLVVEDNTIVGGIGLQAAGLDACSTGPDRDILVQDNTILATAYGVVLTNSSDPVVRDNVIDVSTPNALRAAVVSAESSGSLTV